MTSMDGLNKRGNGGNFGGRRAWERNGCEREAESLVWGMLHSKYLLAIPGEVLSTHLCFQGASAGRHRVAFARGWLRHPRESLTSPGEGTDPPSTPHPQADSLHKRCSLPTLRLCGVTPCVPRSAHSSGPRRSAVLLVPTAMSVRLRHASLQLCVQRTGLCVIMLTCFSPKFNSRRFEGRDGNVSSAAVMCVYECVCTCRCTHVRIYRTYIHI